MPKIFALADTHLGFATGRTMDRFGSLWHDHAARIAANAHAAIGADDILLLPGDLSWARKRDEALPDLRYLAELPGRKIVIKGNHDHWWASDKPVGFDGLTDVPCVIGGVGFAGSRGWNAPVEGTETFATDKKTFERERRRLTKSLASIAHCQTKIVLLHYPPQPFLDILTGAGVSVCVYGHVHRNSLPQDEANAVFEQVIGGVVCYCVACDRIEFAPVWVGSF
ncbi:MAG: metallophosphoesterase [Armatimonadetes bacterium]|nr:metallophosphoesterase [Armatimonadota bacterium]